LNILTFASISIAALNKTNIVVSSTQFQPSRKYTIGIERIYNNSLRKNMPEEHSKRVGKILLILPLNNCKVPPNTAPNAIRLA
jgi:hypothetical protein